MAEAIRQLRRELLVAIEEGEGQALRFDLGTVEFEAQVMVSDTAGGGGGVKFWLVSAEGSRRRSETVTHTLRLSLTPVEADAPASGTGVRVGADVEGVE